MDFCASRHHAVILLGSNTGCVQWSEEAGPAGATVVFMFGAIELEREDRGDGVCSPT